MDTLRDAYRESEDEEPTPITPSPSTANDDKTPTDPPLAPPSNGIIKPEPEQLNKDETSAENPNNKPPSNNSSQNDDDEEDEEEEEEEEVNDDDDEDDDESTHPPSKKQKQLSSLIPQQIPILPSPSPKITPTATTSKKSKKKYNNVWTKPTSRKGKKKGKTSNSQNAVNSSKEDTVLITPIARFPDKSDDTPDMSICLSKVYKAEKVDISDDRLSAGSTKGYRMVRATRGVVEGAWYYEIKVVSLGETGHTRLGWSNDKGDLQAPVGYDGNSFGYRDIDGSKVHKAVREKYGEEGYKEGDVIGFYINLPDGEKFAPKMPHLAWYKGQKYAYGTDGKDESPKVVPGSEISFFKNGMCQGVAFKDLYGGRYYPAASMYTLPNQPNCLVKFNFGPDFEYFPDDFDGRVVPRPMIEVPYHGYDSQVENGELNGKSH